MHHHIAVFGRLATTTAFVVAVTFPMASADAFTYAASYMTSYAGCDTGCNTASSLSYTDDQINKFDSTMRSYGHVLRRKFANSNVWASDYIEDTFGGQDMWYSDDSDIVIFSGVGSGNSCR